MPASELTEKTLKAISEHVNYKNNFRFLDTLHVGMKVKPKMLRKLREMGLWKD